jgi:stage II sporulation protein M
MKHLKKTYSFYRNLIDENKGWLLLTLVIFVSGALTGSLISFLVPSLAEETLRNYANSIETDISLGWDLTSYVLQRNLTITTVAGLLGAVFGLIPSFVTYINGLVLGVVLTFFSTSEQVSLVQLLFLIVPHGVFEYVGVFLVMSFSLKWGLHWVFPKNRGRRQRTFLEDLKKLASIYPLALFLLVLAAIIEGTVTPAIACFVIGVCP